MKKPACRGGKGVAMKFKTAVILLLIPVSIVAMLFLAGLGASVFHAGEVHAEARKSIRILRLKTVGDEIGNYLLNQLLNQPKASVPRYPDSLSELASDGTADPKDLLCYESSEPYVYVGKGFTKETSPNCVVAYEPPSSVRDGVVFLYADGHSEWQDSTNAAIIIADLRAGKNPPRMRY